MQRRCNVAQRARRSDGEAVNEGPGDQQWQATTLKANAREAALVKDDSELGQAQCRRNCCVRGELRMVRRTCGRPAEGLARE